MRRRKIELKKFITVNRSESLEKRIRIEKWKKSKLGAYLLITERFPKARQCHVKSFNKFMKRAENCDL